MESLEFLAKTYAVLSENGVVIDRILLSDGAYEALDLAQAYPGCTLEIDEDNALPIGHGAPPPSIPTGEISPHPPLDVVLRSLTPSQREAIRTLLDSTEQTQPLNSTDEQVTE